MRRFRLFSILSALILLPLTGPLHAQTVAEGGGLKIFLLTMDQGDQVWEKFGHNAIWVHDPVRGTDWVYNYGVFDFDSPGYWSRFIKGNWIYRLAVADIRDTMRQYIYLNRTVTAQELALTPAQARELQEFLEWNARPENAEYLYDYYRDNCSTRVRDALDRVLGGALYRATADAPSSTTYRWHTRRLLQGEIAPYTGVSLALGPAVDRPITLWEEMFLPTKLREQVRDLWVTGPDGREVPLVRSEETLYQAIGRAPEAAAPAPVLGWYLLTGAGIALLLLGLARASTHQGLAGTLGRTGLSALAVLWGLLAGGAGIILAGLWAFTNHTFSYYNENLLQANPLSLAVPLLLPALAFGATWASPPMRWLSILLAASSTLGLILQLIPGFDQVNGEVIALILPVHLALVPAVSWLRRSLSSPRGGTSSGRPVSHRSIAGGR